MSKVDWLLAPDDAQYYANKACWKYNKAVCGYLVLVDGVWVDSTTTLAFAHSPFFYDDVQSKADHIVDATKKVWPTESRIEQIGQNGGDGLHYDEQRESHYATSGAIEQKLMEELVAKQKEAEREAHLRQSVEQNRAPDSFGKYDRRIKGKHNTGTCTVDVYRVLSAFQIIEPELQHCIKKLLAAGQRGAKDYQQDLKEAAVSLGMLIDRLAE